MKNYIFVLFGLILMLALFSGCANYVITQELEAEFSDSPKAYVGEIRDALPLDTPTDKKPSLEDIEKFKNYLSDELLKKEFFTIATSATLKGMDYELTGAIIDYKKGSGFVRFLFGTFGGGQAKVTTLLELKETRSGQIIFSGNFKGFVGSYGESGDKMFERVAKDFAKALRKRVEKQRKNQ
ncbi:MAG: hypothetical protein ABIE07_10520 [Candidatus Zixiibacteriota bacterium]